MGNDISTFNTWSNFTAYHAEVIFRIERDLKAAGAIPLAAYSILIELDTAKERRLRLYDLSKICILTKSGISKIVNTLEKQGFLKRERCPNDKRGFFAGITKSGSDEVHKARRIYRKSIQTYFGDGLKSENMNFLKDILLRLRKNLPDNFMQKACDG